MSKNTVIASFLACVTLALSACGPDAAASSASPSATASASPSASPSPSPSPEQTVEARVNGRDADGNIVFGGNHFGDVPLGLPPQAYADALGLGRSACGDVVAPSLIVGEPGSGDGEGWEAFMRLSGWQDGSANEDDWQVRAFRLSVVFSPATEPFGPVGPQGIRLGMSEAAIADLFPAQHTSATVEEYELISGDSLTLLKVEVGNVDGYPMFIALSDGSVIAITWGDPEYATLESTYPYCNG